jgi:Flp pilus assembly protein TadG
VITSRFPSLTRCRLGRKSRQKSRVQSGGRARRRNRLAIIRRTMLRDLAGSLSSALTRMLRDQRGVSATIVAIALPGLIGFGALGAETGVWYTIKLRNQAAADAAALSAAYEVIVGRTDIASELTPAASEAAARNGYNGTTPAVTFPYSDGVVSNGVAVNFAANTRSVARLDVSVQRRWQQSPWR